MSDSKLVVGKWYAGTSAPPPENFYIKFSHLTNDGYYNQVYGTETISRGTYEPGEDYWENTEFEKYAETHPVSIEEIKQFLPKNHPDLSKIVINDFPIF